jgi:import receptor subunit TOM70
VLSATTVYFVTNEFEKASADYEKSTSLDDKFVFSHVQHAVAQYKMSQTKESMASFRKILKLFPTNFEPLNY